ncbi:MAG: membrane-bound lytic murein transglycosylase D, partial [Ulvibacter sp.]
MNLRLLPYILFFSCVILSAQEEVVKFDSLQKVRIQIVDSIPIQQISSDLLNTVVATKTKDTMVFALEDMANARKYDSLWLKQLYNSELFEEVYGFVGNQDYSPVPYEELSTEVLKQRLKLLNARTPFNVEYNPSLESVIKGYLKNRRKTITKLMALSDYYFPMFEEELDRYNLPLEMKYLAIVESALNPRAVS